MVNNPYLSEDPRGLIHEAYQMELRAEESREIFLDWALKDAAADSLEAIKTLLAFYEPRYPEHPMSGVLREGLEASVRPRARRGRRAKP
ncbi:MAG: hypothetical protein AAFQ36_04785 [Pseudomonadota bacterium]